MGTVVELRGEEARLHQHVAASGGGMALNPQGLLDIGSNNELPRLGTGSGELDRLLGGGLVQGSALVLGGAPGIGKSTLLAQVCGIIGQQHPVLYCTAEESVEQVRDRCARLGLATAAAQLQLAASADCDALISAIAGSGYRLVVVDSIQLLNKTDIDGIAGSPSQVRGCTTALVAAAKATGTTLLIIGHVTKDGQLAGPRLLEHLVDTVLAFEGDHERDLRCLRAVKHRFGATGDLALFTMHADGLQDVADPAGLFIEHRNAQVSGSCIVPVIEGNRCLLVEVQALVNQTDYPQPTRRVSGLDNNRVAMIAAVLGRRARLPLGSCDVFVNATGGVQIREPAADLGIAMAIASAWRDEPVPRDAAFIGEVGLGGELRPVARYDLRAAAARRLGFKRLIGPGPGKGRGRIVSSSLAEVIEAVFASE